MSALKVEKHYKKSNFKERNKKMSQLAKNFFN